MEEDLHGGAMSEDGDEAEDMNMDAGDGGAYLLGDVEVEGIIVCWFVMAMTFLWSQIDRRSVRAPRNQTVTVRSNFWELMKKQRSPTAFRKTLRCSPDSFDALVSILEPRYYEMYRRPGPNAQYSFDHGFAVLLAYYGNGGGLDGDDIGGAAAQMGMSRTAASRFITNFEWLLSSMADEVIQFPDRQDAAGWTQLTQGFKRRGGLFPDVACVFDGTTVRTTRPRLFQGFYDKSFQPSYNCLACIDYKMRFRYMGVFTGSNSDQSMWNQSMTLGTNARNLCPPGVNWLADSGFKLLPFLMVPFDERGGKKLTRKQRCYNYHLSSTRMLVECAFGRLKGRFKVLQGVTNRKQHATNTRMIIAAAVLHNLLIDVGDQEVYDVPPEPEATLRSGRLAINVLARGMDRTKDELAFATAKRNTYMERFYAHDHDESDGDDG